MSRKIVAAVLAVALASTGAVFAEMGLGLQGGYTAGGGAGAAVTFKVESLPCVFAVDLSFGGGLGVGATADWWLANPEIMDNWYWYYGFGAAAGVFIGDDWLGLSAAPRAVVGTSYFLLDGFLELYAQAAWQPTLQILPDIGFSLVSFPINAGFRVWF